LNTNQAERISFLAVIALLVLAFAVGGGGSREGLANLAVQLGAIMVLMLHREAFVQFWRESPLALRGLIGASLLLPLIQIIPLPPAVWSALPGRELVTRSLATVGEVGWMPFSLYPQRTLLALTALVTPLAVLVAGWSLPRHHLLNIGWVIVALGLVTTLFGLAQLGATGDDGTLFGARNPGKILLGTFANRNSTGLFLCLALALAALLPVPKAQPAVLLMRIMVCGVLLITIVLTKSRTAMALAMLPLALAGIKALWWSLRERAGAGGAKRPLAVALGAMALLAVGGGALIIAPPGPIGEALARFEAKDDPRRYIWDDAAFTATRYWPTGAGMGAFDEVFQVDESLESLTKRTAGRAHNDWLELAIEAGLAGLALAVLWMVLIGWLSWRVRHSSQRWAAWSGSTFLLAIALQSITDYPLRNQTILAFAGFALLLLVRIACKEGRERS
jgi:O-antigen ligase